MEAGSLKVYRGCTPVADAVYESDNSSSPTAVVIEALADAADVDPEELTPLYEFIDPDVIDGLFERHDGTGDAKALLSFTVDTWNVFVHEDGRVRVCDATRSTDPEPVFATNSA